MSNCTTIQQGYPNPLHTQKDCQLSHTGFGLEGPAMLAAIVILIGVGMWIVARAGRRV